MRSSKGLRGEDLKKFEPTHLCGAFKAKKGAQRTRAPCPNPIAGRRENRLGRDDRSIRFASRCRKEPQKGNKGRALLPSSVSKNTPGGQGSEREEESSARKVGDLGTDSDKDADEEGPLAGGCG